MYRRASEDLGDSPTTWCHMHPTRYDTIPCSVKHRNTFGPKRNIKDGVKLLFYISQVFSILCPGSLKFKLSLFSGSSSRETALHAAPPFPIPHRESGQCLGLVVFVFISICACIPDWNVIFTNSFSEFSLDIVLQDLPCWDSIQGFAPQNIRTLHYHHQVGLVESPRKLNQI